MGYFGRKLRRKRCAAEIAAAMRPIPDAMAEVWAAAPLTPPAKGTTRCLRLVVGSLDPSSGRQQGIFRAAGELVGAGSLGSADSQRLNEALTWFNRNLAVPRDVTPHAIFWLKSDAVACVQRAWDIVHVLQGQGIPIWLLTTRRPGRIVYEDAHQLAAVPFSEAVRRDLVAGRRADAES